MAAADRILAGGNKSRFMPLTSNGAVPVVSTTVAFELFGDIVSANIQRQDTGQYDLSIDHVRDNNALKVYLNAYIDLLTSSAIGELVTEDGVKEAAATSSNPQQIALVGGGQAGATAGAIRKVWVGPQRLKSSSGAYQQNAETWNHVSLNYEGFKLGGACTIVATFFNSLSLAPAVFTIAAATPYGDVVYA